MDQSKLPQLEWLPAVVVDILIQYLSEKDLAACCATSHRMREMFGSDRVWKSRCDPRLARHLRDTRPQVTPEFVSPENETTTISAISEWRLAYMRQNHLYNNWCLGRFKVINQGNLSLLQARFVSEYHLFISSTEKLNFVDTRQYFTNSSEYQCGSNELPTPVGHIHATIVANSMMFIVLSMEVRVYYLDDSSQKWSLKNTLLIPSSSASHNPSFSNASAVVGNFFVAFLKFDSTVHVWDTVTGLKVKENTCPLDSCLAKCVKPVDNLNALVIVKSCRNSPLTCLVYSLSKLDYLPFRVTRDLYGCVGCGDFVCVFRRDPDIINVYNYHTSEIVLQNCSGYQVQCLEHNFLFLQDKSLKLFDCRTHQVVSLQLTGIVNFTIASNRLLLLRCRGGNYVCRISPTNKVVKKEQTEFVYFQNAKINEFCTMYIDRDNLLMFW